MSKPMDYGRAITLNEANAIIQTHQTLNSFVERKPTGDITPEANTLFPEFAKRDFNAFIFHKDLIDRFFHNGQDNADYLVVLLGAHPAGINDPNFKPGSFTVVTTGCKDISSPANLELETIKIEKPANEYPPKKTAVQLVKSERITAELLDDSTMKFTVL